MNIMQRLRKSSDPTGGRERLQGAARGQLLEDIREVRRQLEGLQSYFALETDEDLLDAAIYQREALEARHRYLLRLARESNTCAGIPVVTEEERWIN